MDKTESLKNLYTLSEQRFDKIQQIIIEDNTAIAKPSDSPVVIILGAQPGAGKTELERIARAELGGNIINCNADLFRDYHPDAHEIKSRFESYYPSLTAKYAQDWNNGLRAHCEANRLNYILETTFSSGPGMNKTIDELQKKGYRVEIKLLAIHPRLSLLGTHLRFEEMKSREKGGRMVGKEVHDQKYEMVAPTLYTVQSAALYNKLQIYGRSVEPVEGSFKLGVYLIDTNPPNPLQLFQDEVDRKWSPEFSASFNQGVQNAVHFMQARNATEQEIKAFLKDMQTEYPTQKQLQLKMEQQIKEQEFTEQLNKRLAGELPHIDINGTDFTIDLRVGELRETNAPGNSIHLHQMQAGRPGEAYLFFYHTQKHTVYDPPANIKSLPKNVVVVEIPVEAKLDPVATAEMLGVDIKEFVKSNQLQNELTAVVKPLSQTRLPELIQQNLRTDEQLRSQRDRQNGRDNDEDLDQSFNQGPRIGR